jgi:RNA polymerase sigma factor (sigma-70 family)
MAVEPVADEEFAAQADEEFAAQAAAGHQRTSGRSLIAGERVSDELLARLVASGGERPFRSLYDRYRQSLYGYCHSILRNEADAQDALQSTFTKALMALREGRRNAPLRPWLYRIAHNEAVSILRDRGAAEKRLERVPRRAEAPSVEERAGDRARLSSLLEDLAQLPDRARGALVMRELGGLSHEEIASALGLSVGAAKQAIFEARRGLLELAEGRAMSCDDVTRRLSDGDRRAFRGRRVRAHLQDCRACAAFAAAIPQRHGELRALAPLLPPASAAAVLERALSSSSGSASGAGSAGSAGSASGSGSGGAAGSGSGSAGAAGSGSAGAAGSSGAGAWTTAGLVAKPLVSALAPKALLALAVSAGVAAGGVALGVSGGHPSPRALVSSQPGGGARYQPTNGIQASAPFVRATIRSPTRQAASAPAASPPGGQEAAASGCGECPANVTSQGNALEDLSTDPATDSTIPAQAAAAGSQEAAIPGASSPAPATSPPSPPPSSPAPVAAAHGAKPGAIFASPRSGGHANAHSGRHSAGTPHPTAHPTPLPHPTGTAHLTGPRHPTGTAHPTGPSYPTGPGSHRPGPHFGQSSNPSAHVSSSALVSPPRP